MNQIANYYSMLDLGYFTHEPNRPKGFSDFPQGFMPGKNVPAGVVADRPWRHLTVITPTWRNALSDEYQSSKVTELLRTGKLKATVFSDVDYAVMDRDAQQHVDQYIADRATLESLGFVAQFYETLRNPSIRLEEIQRHPSAEKSFEIGQELLHRALKEIPTEFIKPGKEKLIEELQTKAQLSLTDEDYKLALDGIHDGFYQLIINPLSEYFQREHKAPLLNRDLVDAQSGDGRMDLIYTTIAAFSHVSIKDRYEMIRHETFGQFDANEHLYPGVRDFFEELRQHGIDSVAITRGNQVPYIKGSGSNIDDLFDRVHSTLISHNRSSNQRDPLYPKKRVRPYSQVNDNLSSTDKIRIMVHETLHAFSRAQMRFSSPQELIDSVATYLDHCIFITDADKEVWGTCPTVAVMALRTPDEGSIQRFYDSLPEIPSPIAIINPQQIQGPLHGISPDDVLPDFSPRRPEISKLIDILDKGQSPREILDRVSVLPESPRSEINRGLEL